MGCVGREGKRQGEGREAFREKRGDTEQRAYLRSTFSLSSSLPLPRT